ncbi:MAG: glycosyltransferase family 87 protein [Anaeromyxobacteraceae bacterium]
MREFMQAARLTERVLATRAVRALLGVLVVAYILIGLAWSWSFIRSGSSTDFEWRWQEISYVVRGVDPYTVLHDQTRVLDEIGRPGGVYPPWSYALALPFVWPVSRNAAILVFVLWNVFAVVWMVRSAPQLIPSGEPNLLRLASVAPLATLPLAIGLRHLNYGLLLTAAVVAFALQLRKGREALAGVFLAMVAIKPHFGALFFLVPLVRRKWTPLGIAGGLIALAAAAVWFRTGVDPIRMLRGLFSEGVTYENAYLGLLNPLRSMGASTQLVTTAGLVGGGLLAIVLAVYSRHATALAALAGMAAVSKLWAYHHTHDLIAIGLVVLALIELVALENSNRSWMALAAGCVSFWTPYMSRFDFMPIVPEAFRLVWLGLAFFVVACQRSGETFKPTDAEATP